MSVSHGTLAEDGFDSNSYRIGRLAATLDSAQYQGDANTAYLLYKRRRFCTQDLQAKPPTTIGALEK